MTVAALILLGAVGGLALALLVRFIQRGGRVHISVDDRPLSRLLAVAMTLALVLVLARLVVLNDNTHDCLQDTQRLTAHILAQNRGATPTEAAHLREGC